MAKKIDYAAMFTLRKDGRYVAVRPNKDKSQPPKHIYDRDPEALYHRIEALKYPTAPLFKTVAEMWHDAKWEKIAAGTQVCYSGSYKRALDEQAGKLITDIIPADIDRHIKKIAAQGMSKKSVSTQRTVYNLIFEYAIISEDPAVKGWVKINPVSSVHIPRGLPVEKREAPEDDIIQLIRNNVDKPFGLFPMVAINTGFRKAEILPLTWGDIDYNNKKVKCTKAIEYSAQGMPLKEPKTKAGTREVPLLYDLERVLKRPKGAKVTDLIIHNDDGSMLTSSDYDRMWLSWCAAVGLTKTVHEKRGARIVNSTRPALGAHQLRHGYATILFEAGVDVYAAKELLGHANIETTMAIYTHLRNKQRNKATDALNQFMNERYSSPDSDKKLTKK